MSALIEHIKMTSYQTNHFSPQKKRGFPRMYYLFRFCLDLGFFLEGHSFFTSFWHS
jgi:hypothetical protein